MEPAPGESEQVRSLPRLVAGSAALLVALLGLAAGPQQAAPYPPCGCSSSIGRANLDGSGADPTFIAETVGSHEVAVDAGHVYWTNPGFGIPTLWTAIGRANLDGTDVGQQFIPTVNPASGPAGVAVDDEHVYWTNPGPSTIGRANVDGTDVEQSFITTSDAYFAVNDVAIDPLHVYWTDTAAGTIGRADLDGTDVDPDFITGAAGPDGLAVDSAHVYWANTADVGAGDSAVTIGRADLEGTDVDQSFISTASILGPYSVHTGVAVDSGHIYWTNGTASTLGRANLDGTGVDQGFVTGASYPEDVAVDDGHLYWANWAWDDDITPPATEITRRPRNKVVSKTGRPVEVKFAFSSDESGSSFECKLDEKPWKGCDSPKRYRVRPGEHRFKVRATDPAGNTDPGPAKDKFKVVRN